MARVTLEQIARQAGVNRGTVSRALNPLTCDQLSQGLVVKIRQVAASLNYMPNAAARATRTGRSNGVGLLMSTHVDRSYFTGRLLEGIHDALAQNGMHLLLARVPDEKIESQDSLPQMFKTMLVDGLLINYTHHLPSPLSEAIGRNTLPTVWINIKQDVNTVYPDNYRAAFNATQQLLSLGHKKVAYIDAWIPQEMVATSHYNVSDRPAGYTAAMQQMGLPPRIIRPAKCQGYDQFDAFMRSWLKQEDRPTAVLCNWHTMVPSILYCCGELGLKVPRDLSIIAFSPEHMQALAGTCVTTMAEPDYEVGQQAVKMLLQRISDPGISLPAVKVDFLVEDLNTCVAPIA